MARVYRAEDTLLGRTVAVKLLRPGVDGASSPERARAEVAVLAGLAHPALVMLLDARLEPGKPEYLVMEFVDGPTLAAVLSAGPLPAEDVAALGAELGEALHTVHAAGVVHRDLKPSNILLASSALPHRRFRPKLADFGIAYLLDSTRLTSPGAVIGTAAYLAPEQVRGAEPAPAADIYALGLVLLEALSGRRAFPAGSAVEVALARLTAAPDIPADISPEWRSLIERMTDTEPSRRPSALEVAVAVGALGAGGASPPDMPTAVLPPVEEATAPTLVAATAGAPDVTGRRRRPVVWGAAGAVLAGALALGAWTAMTTATANPTPGVTTPAANDPSVTPTPTQPPGTGTATPEPGVVAPAGEPPAVTTDDDEEAEKAQRDAEREQEKQQRDAEKQQKDAERDRERPDKGDD